MSPYTHQHRDAQEHESATARIEAQDVAFAAPLREYLEAHGCRVVVNQATKRTPLYEICVGDSDFVKSFFADEKISPSKKMGIVYEGDDSGLSHLGESGIKLYLADARPLGEAEVTNIFTFFFTGKSSRADSRKEPMKPVGRSGAPQYASRERSSPDEKRLVRDSQRIALMMRQMFPLPAGSRKPKRKHKHIFRLVAVCVLIVLTPVVMYWASLLVGAGLLVASGKTLSDGNVPLTQTLRKASTPYIQSAKTVLHVVSPLFALLKLHGFVEDHDRLLSLFSDVSFAESGVIKIYTSSKTIAGSIFFPQNDDTATSAFDVSELTSEVSRVSQHLALVQAELDSLMVSKRFPFHTVGVQALGRRGLHALTQVRTIVEYTQRLLMLYPEMAGFRRTQTYVVLLQNSMELRPTGGFIGSLLSLSFTDGKVVDLKVVDVYTADGQLKGHVDPPFPIREIIGQEHWYLRDSNWNPDFFESGKQAAWFYEKEMGQSVDGVIAVSLPVLTELLHVLGPIELTDFNERISESNFFAKSLLYTQTDFFPGSTQKKDFLGALVNALLLRMTTDSSVSSGSLLRVVANSLRRRDVQFYFADMDIERLVTQWEWAGRMDRYPCEPFFRESSCIGDGVAVIEANVGVNKVNYFVTHEALSHITLKEDGVIQQILTIKIHNAMPQELADGGGAYQDYLRLYYPKNTSVRSVRLDGADVPLRDFSHKVPPPAPYLVVEASGASSVAGVMMRVEPRQTRQLTVETDRHMPEISGSWSYQFSLRKQSGVSRYPWHVVVHYPSSWGAVSEGGVANASQLEYNTDLTEDADVRILFQKQ